MKRLAFTLLMLAAGMASADNLGDAEKALRAKEYDKALPMYTKLANAGNVEAQFRLGEMYWYGDGTAVDMAKSQSWLQKAAASGHGGAKETLLILQKREQRTADIAYWTSGYKGEDLASGKYACPMPAIPAVSKTNAEIKAVSEGIAKWESCYNDFVTGVNQLPPANKRIPADVLQLMSPREAEQAIAHVDDATVSVVTRRQNEALSFTSERDAWHKATNEFVVAANSKLEAEKSRLATDIRRAEDDRKYNNRPTGAAK
jgi:TPR repeat protein